MSFDPQVPDDVIDPEGFELRAAVRELTGDGPSPSVAQAGRCGHLFNEYGKSFVGTLCADYRRCVICGVFEYKNQSERWPS